MISIRPLPLGCRRRAAIGVFAAKEAGPQPGAQSAASTTHFQNGGPKTTVALKNMKAKTACTSQ